MSALTDYFSSTFHQTAVLRSSNYSLLRQTQVAMSCPALVRACVGNYTPLDGVRDVVVLQLPDQFRKYSVKFMVAEHE